MATPELSEEYRAILDFETRHPHWKYIAVKEGVIREMLGHTPTRYYQLLGHVIDEPAALAYAPQTVRRLQRLRDARLAARRASRRAS